MALRVAAMALGFVAVSTGQAWSWGDLGHRIVCEIAFQELNDKARAEVLRLIQLDQEFRTFSDACTWPDHPRKRAEEHFINVPRAFQRFTAAECPEAAKCLFTAIVEDLEVLLARPPTRPSYGRSSSSGTGSGTFTSRCMSHSRMTAGETTSARAAPVRTVFIRSGIRAFCLSG